MINGEEEKMGLVSYTKGVKTRKDHNCFGCRKVIPKGTVLNDSVCTDDGQIYHVRLCEVCEHLAEQFQQNGDEWYQGDLAEQPYWNEAKKEIEKINA